jgi:hypothetical protein
LDLEHRNTKSSIDGTRRTLRTAGIDLEILEARADPSAVVLLSQPPKHKYAVQVDHAMISYFEHS